MKHYRIESRYIGGTDDELPEGAVEVPGPPEDARQPWTGEGWGEVPPVVPASCGPAQAKIVLWEAGLLDAVEAMVADHPYRPVSIWYAAATIWERSHPYVTALAYEIGLTDEQMDDLFSQAVMK
jgi:hypothetical protein